MQINEEGKHQLDVEATIVAPRVSGPTNEKNPRVELCAKSPEGRRVHVFTLVHSVVGDKAIVICKAVQQAIVQAEASGTPMSKADALKMRDEYLY